MSDPKTVYDYDNVNMILPRHLIKYSGKKISELPWDADSMKEVAGILYEREGNEKQKLRLRLVYSATGSSSFTGEQFIKQLIALDFANADTTIEDVASWFEFVRFEEAEPEVDLEDFDKKK